MTLLKKALLTVEKNKISYPEGFFFTAGAHQFKSLWVRDFCYSVPGLLKAGFVNEVTDQLLFFSQHIRADDHALPRGFDFTSPKLRVVWATVSKHFPDSLFQKKQLRSEYYGEHGTLAFDSNFLFLKALCVLADFQKTSKLLISHEQIQRLLCFYKNYWSDGLLNQPVFSDWQDSAAREGCLLLSQLTYLDMINHLNMITNNHFYDVQLNDYENKILSQFYDLKLNLFFEDKHKRQISLDSYLLILNSDLIFKSLDKNQLYNNLKNHPLWKQKSLPGTPVYPEYLPSQVSWTTKAVGLRHYHDNFIWGWLAADAYRASIKMNDRKEADRILKLFNDANINENYLCEIYESKKNHFVPVKKLLYTSESPFTWTAAKWIQALRGSTTK